MESQKMIFRLFVLYTLLLLSVVGCNKNELEVEVESVLVLTQKVFELPCTANELTVELKINIAVDVLIPDTVQWISYTPPTKATTEYLKLKIAPNEFNIRRMGVIVIRQRNGLLVDTIIVHQQAGTRPIKVDTLGLSGADSTYTFFNSNCLITSEKRLKSIHLYANRAGRVYVDFYSPMSKGWHSVKETGFANTGNEYIAVKKGLNAISSDRIRIPDFLDSAYVGVRADAGVLRTQASTADTAGYQIHDQLLEEVPYRIAYDIETYPFDLVELIKTNRFIDLPQGTIEINSPLVLNNITLTGRGVLGTLLYARVASGAAIELHNSQLAEFTLMGQSDIGANLENKFSTIEQIRTLQGVNVSGSCGIDVASSSSQIEGVRVLGFDYYGIRNRAYARVAHNLFNRINVSGCGVGLEILEEYAPMSNMTVSNCVNAIRIGAGNVFVSNSSFNDNNCGLYMWKAGNDSHGSFTCCNFNHNKFLSIVLDQISHGETFSGCHVFQGEIYLYRSIGFTWSAGIIDCEIYVQGGHTQSLTNTAFQNAYWDRSTGVKHDYNQEQSRLIMTGNYFMFESGQNDHIINRSYL